jgi:hypothetical protein
MPEEKYMRIFHALIIGVLLLLLQLPVGQAPPRVALANIYADVHAFEGIGKADVSVEHSRNGERTLEAIQNHSGEWYLDFSPITYLGFLDYFLPSQVKQISQPPEPSPTPTITPVNRASASPSSISASNSTTVDGALATYRQATSLPIAGYAMFYNPNVMQEVVANRLQMGHIAPCGECIGNIALLRAGDLNRRVWLQWPDGTVEGPFLVADVAARHHVPQLLARNWAVDVDYQTAVRRRMTGPVWVTVLGSPPANQQSTQPFAPLYSEFPGNDVAFSYTSYAVQPTAIPASAPVVQSPTPTLTPLPAIYTGGSGTLPAEQTIVKPASFPTDTPVPLPTPLPAIVLTAVPVSGIEASRPTDTPTITPLPAIIVGNGINSAGNNSPYSTATSQPVFAPTSTPTATPVAANAEPPVKQASFPPDTPVPTITPLPALYP